MEADDFEQDDNFQIEFQINRYITLRLEDGKSNIYVQGELFRVCKQLILNIPKSRTHNYDDIDSIDAPAEIYNSTEERLDFIITPDQEFRAHCSNLQVWHENDYDTRILHSNLAFPLLKKLVEAGDPIARRVYKQEITERFGNGHLNTITCLIENDYLDSFTREELQTFLDEDNSASKALLQGLRNDYPHFRETILRFFEILGTFGNDFIITHFQDFIKNLDSFALVNFFSSITNQMERESFSTFLSNNAMVITERIIEILLQYFVFNMEIKGSLKNLYLLIDIILNLLPEKEASNNLKALNYFNENFRPLFEKLNKGVIGNWEHQVDQLKKPKIITIRVSILVLRMIIKQLIAFN